MTGWRDPESWVRALADEHVPPESPEVAADRRERIVPILSRAMRGCTVDRERRRMRRRWLVGFSLAAAAMLGVGFAWRVVTTPNAPSTEAAGATAKARVATIQKSVATIQKVTGTLVVTHGSEARVVRKGEQPELAAGDEVRTAADSGAELNTERSAVRIAPATQLSILAPSSAEERIRLGVGHVELNVSKQLLSPRSVVVETPNADVVVRGTKFSVDVDRQGTRTTTRVHVREGSVWVVHGAGRDLVTTGESWSSAAPVTRGVAPEPIQPLALNAKANRPQPHRSPARSEARLGGTLAEENRMFQAAVDARNRGEDARAAELFGGLLARYPKSRLAEESRIERMRAFKRAGEAKRAAAEARRYLADHGEGFARDEARSNALAEK